MQALDNLIFFGSVRVVSICEEDFDWDYVVAKSHSAILHICSISLRCDPSWFFNGETKCR